MSHKFRDAALVSFAAALFIAGVVTAPAATTPQVDPLSKECIGCHDGASGPNVEVNLRNNPAGRGSHVHSFQGEHPIGMIYQSYVDMKPGYKPISAQERNMIMVNGAVGCLTCHDPLNPAKGHLIKSDKNSALCLTCHDK